MDKMVCGQDGIKQNGMDNMITTFCIDFNSIEFNLCWSPKVKKVINTQRKPKGVKVEAGLMKKIVSSVGAGLID